jgi:hypothetical protein
MKTILHLCADIGSDSYIWQQNGYNVIKVGKDIGIENFSYSDNVYGIIANPPCTEFSTARANGKARDPQKGMELVNHCLRIVKECNPKFWVIENPAKGALKDILGPPKFKYQPWQFGSPWTKETALWGKFVIPEATYKKWEDVPKLDGLYIRPTRKKPSLAFMHAHTHMKLIPEFSPFTERVLSEKSRSKDGGADMSFRSLCSQNFAKAFYEVNKNEEK